MKKSVLLLLVLCFSFLSYGEDKGGGKLLLKEGARLAVVGDSITEQKKYSAYIEMYLAVCFPQLKVRNFQFGWSGEQATGFAKRMDNDMLDFKPGVVTLCYGMNDAGYKAYSENTGNKYEATMDKIVKKLKDAGVLVIAGSPGAVDTKCWKGKAGPEVYNETLKKFGEIGKKIATNNQIPFADVHGPMMEAMEKAKKELGEDYDVCGKDGVHPSANGHLIMAQAFLKAMGFDGDLGTITIDMKGPATATGGHKVLSSSAGKVEIESSRYPFCFYGDGKSSSSDRSILPYISFNRDLNRLTLVVKNLEGSDAKVEWGNVSKTFKREQLEKGINLADEFLDNPFSEPFKNIMAEIVKKEVYETEIIKGYITSIPRKLVAAETEQAKEEIIAKRTGMWAEWEKKQNNLPALVVPVKHTLNIIN